MIYRRFSLVFAVAILAGTGLAAAQGTASGSGTGSSDAASGGSSGSSGGSSGTSGTSGTSEPSSAFGLGSSGTSGQGATSNFGSGTGTSRSPFSVFSSAGASGADEESSLNTPSFGLAPKVPPQTPPSFTLPGFYGQGSQTLFGGYGRLARPRFQTTLSFTFGYDDNVFQTPRDNTPTLIPGVNTVTGEPKVEVVREPVPAGTPIIEEREVFLGGGIVGVRPVVVGFTTEDDPGEVRQVFDKVKNEVVGSFFSRANFGFQMTQFTRTSLFTLDLSVGRTFYWDKDEDPVDYNGGVSMVFLKRLTPRLQMTAQVNAAYISQPDLTRPNTPERQIRGDLLNSLARFDLSYRFSPRLSLTGTFSYNGERYTEKAEQSGDSDEFTGGLELRYLWQPRWTLLTEYRHSMITYPNQSVLDSQTDYLLVGSEFIINPRLTGSLRFGVAMKRFEEGGSQTAPYAETTLTYQSTKRSVITWSNRFGFEEAALPGDERLVYRSTLGYNYAITPRMRGSAAVTILHEITTNKNNDSEFAQDTFDANLGLEYEVSRNFSLNLGYSFTLVNSNVGISDYYRNRVTFGGEYVF
jgi:hypothetical protein